MLAFMARKFVKVISIIALFVLYAWICLKFYLFLEVDACLDVGGSFDYATGRCLGSSIEHWPPLALRAPFLLWLVMLGLPALLVWGLYRFVGRVLRHWGIAL